ncbi:MAG: hypothetical protein MPL62_10780, partial [Alphaproteobacteria bacterium]|nr:hypothetical protein [Alphaproteobacteria bacterium]
RASPHPLVGIARLSQHCDFLSQTPTNAKGSTPILIDPLNGQINFLIFLRASPHPSAGIARLSQHCDFLSQTPTNAKGCSSFVS